MAFGLSKLFGDAFREWKKNVGQRVQPKLYALCPGCGKSSIRYRKLKNGNKRKIVCMRKGCGYVSQSWTVGGPRPNPQGSLANVTSHRVYPHIPLLAGRGLH